MIAEHGAVVTARVAAPAPSRTAALNDFFSRLATKTARQSGKASTFMLATGTIVVWAISGPLFHWSDTWQLVINTGTTIITFLMVFLIQNTQNRDTQALHLKLDELIRVNVDARNSMMNLEDSTEAHIKEVKEELAAECDETSDPDCKPGRKPARASAS
jgi:low affinity Fe/Cu permease